MIGSFKHAQLCNRLLSTPDRDPGEGIDWGSRGEPTTNRAALAVGAFLQLSGTQSAHKLHTSVLQGLGHTAATGFGIEPTCGRLAGILG